MANQWLMEINGDDLLIHYYIPVRHDIPGEMVHEVKTQHFFGGYPWIFMDRQWKSMKVHGYPRKKCCVLTSWTFMDVHEVPRISMDFHGPFRLGSYENMTYLDYTKEQLDPKLKCILACLLYKCRFRITN